MATPTPGRPGAQVVATPPVSTPFSSNHHLAFSPHGPRSVQPSPQHVKKSPANSNTMYGYPTGGGHPTNSSFGAGYDSPSAAMALGGVPGLAELGLDGMGVPGGMGTPSLGGVTVERRDEDERRRKLGQVMDILKVSKGRLSASGIERLARRVGLECLWEAHMGSGGSTQTLIIAGSALALDIDFRDNVVQKVSLSFPESPEIVTRHTEKAGDVLLRDLQFRGGESQLTKMLDRFAGNLDRLAGLDKLSVIPGLNCHEAIAGVFESLERVHRWEVEKLRAEGIGGKDQGEVERVAMCTRSGKPIMHTRDRLGLSLDYWQEKRRLGLKKEVKTWSLLVDCAPIRELVYSSLRVSEHWISSDIQKKDPSEDDILLAPEGGVVLDWLEPESTLLPSTDPPKTDPLEGFDQAPGSKYPEVMFIAKFDPPLTVPYSLAAQIYNSTNAQLDIYQTTTFDGLLFPPSPDERTDVEGRIIVRQSSVPIFTKDGDKSDSRHETKLWIEKSDYGRTISDLPFSHPRQLVEMLPALRQYAFLSTILEKTFGSSLKPAPKEKAQTNENSKSGDFDAFMSPDPPPKKATPFRIDVQLYTQPIPKMRVVFPFKKANKLTRADVTFEIKLNGSVEVVEQNLISEGSNVTAGADAMDSSDMKEKRLTAKDLGRMLEISEDLGIWVEFIKRRFG